MQECITLSLGYDQMLMVLRHCHERSLDDASFVVVDMTRDDSKIEILWLVRLLVYRDERYARIAKPYDGLFKTLLRDSVAVRYPTEVQS